MLTPGSIQSDIQGVVLVIRPAEEGGEIEIGSIRTMAGAGQRNVCVSPARFSYEIVVVS
jgi:hypothetical protein